MDFSQPGIFNVLDYGMSPAHTPAANAAALQAAIDDAQATPNPDGAIVLIPSFDDGSPPSYGSYQIQIPSTTVPAISIPATDNDTPLFICGTGSGTTLEAVGSGTLFDINDGNNSAVTFQDLTITSSSTANSVTAFDVENGFLSSFFRVNVVDCFQAFVIKASSTTLLQCSVTYDSAYPSDASCTGVWIKTSSGQPTNVDIEQCLLTCANLNEGSTGIYVDYSDNARVTDTQVSGFYTGIYINNTYSNTSVTRAPTFAGLNVDATGSCVKIESGVYDVSFVSCHFEPTPMSTAPTNSGIILSPGLAGNPGIDTVRFTSCAVVGYSGSNYGLEINGGQNIQVTGGNYSGNGDAGIAILGGLEIQITGANCVGLSYAGGVAATTQLYGIYATAGQDIQITGVNCSGNGTSSEDLGAGIYLNATTIDTLVDIRILGAICCGPTLGGTSSVQAYGIYANLASGLLIDGCTLTNNTAYGAYLNGVHNVTVAACDVYSSASGSVGIGIFGLEETTENVYVRNCNGAQYSPNYDSVVDVAGEVTYVEVTNCAGYNDVGAELATSPPSGTFGGTTYGYYGPSSFYLVAPSTRTVSIDGTSTSLSQGAFTLAPGQTAQITGTGTITHFLMIGQ